MKYYFVLIFTVMLLLPVNAFAEHTPEWIKNIAQWWSEEKISESEYLNAIQFLVAQKIIVTNADNDIIKNMSIVENELKAFHFQTIVDSRLMSVDLLGDTAEFQSFAKFLELSQNSNIALDKSFLHNELISRFTHFAEFDLYVDQVRILDKTGMEIIRIDNIDGEYVPVSDNLLQDKSDRYYFQEALSLKPDEIFISNIDLNEEFGKVEIPHISTLRIMSQIHDSSSQVNGYLIVNFNMNFLLDYYSKSNYCDVIIFDQDTSIIVHPDKSIPFASQLGLGSSVYENYFQIEKMEFEGIVSQYMPQTGKTIILHVTNPYTSDRYWHFVCELE